MSAKVVVDVNIWLSFCIGHLLDDLPRLVALPDVELFTCLELNTEFVEVSTRPKLKKYIRKARITGDNLLLDLDRHNHTTIIKYRDFCALLGI